MSDSQPWTEVLAQNIRLSDNIRVGGQWATVTAVHVGDELVDLHAAGKRMTFAHGTSVMVVTRETVLEILSARHEHRREWDRRMYGRLIDESEPWYLKLLNWMIDRWGR